MAAQAARLALARRGNPQACREGAGRVAIDPEGDSMRLLLVFALVWALAGCSVADESATEAAEPAKNGGMFIDADSLVVASASEYHSDFDKNAIASLKKYGYQPFVLKGEVDSVETTNGFEVWGEWREANSFTNAVVKLRVEDSYYKVSAILNEAEFAGTLGPGDRVALLCAAVADIPLHAAAECFDANAATWEFPEVKRKALAE